jgi:quercetin dioxygenase-like cupin family protein
MDSIKNIIPKILAPGIAGHYVHGEQMTFGYVELKAGSSVPMHQHVQEQITYILSGELDMTIDGKPCMLTSGMYHVIGSNIWHAAVAKTDCTVIDVFSPVRQDYKNPVA